MPAYFFCAGFLGLALILISEAYAYMTRHKARKPTTKPKSR